MKNKIIQRISPLALGAALCSYQVLQMPLAYGASLKNVSAAEDQLLKPTVPELQSAVPGTPSGCALNPVKGGTPTESVNANPSGSALPPSILASSATESVASSTVVASTAGSSTVVAQVPLTDDCCEIGGTTTCEVGGLPPRGGGIGSLANPLLGLLALPLAAVPFLINDGGKNSTPVPESSSTAGLVAGFGLLGLWLGRRRFGSGQKVS